MQAAIHENSVLKIYKKKIPLHYIRIFNHSIIGQISILNYINIF